MPNQGDDTFCQNSRKPAGHSTKPGNHPRGKPPGTFGDRLRSSSTQPVRSGHDPAKLPGPTILEQVSPPTPLTMKTGGTNEQQPVAWLRTATTPTRLQWTAALHTAGIWRATPVRLRRAATLRRQRLRCAPTTTEEKPHRPDSRARRGPGHRPGLRSLVVPRQGQPANRRSVRDRHHHAGVLADSQQHRPAARRRNQLPRPRKQGFPARRRPPTTIQAVQACPPPRCPSRSMVSRP